MKIKKALRKTTRLVYILAILVCETLYAQPSKKPEALRIEQKMHILGLIYSEVKENFVNFDQYYKKWDSIYISCIRKALETKNNRAFYSLAAEMLANLNDGHTQFVNTELDFFDYPKLLLKIVNSKVYVVSVNKSLINKIPLGSEVVELEGIPTFEYLKKRMYPSTSASTEKDRLNKSLYKIYWDDKDKPFRFTIITPDKGKYIKLKIPRNRERERNEKLDPIMGYYEPKMKPFNLTNNEDSIAILNINTFDPMRISTIQLDSLIEDAKKSKGLIIDLRYNKGGSTEIGIHLLKYLIKERFFLTYGWETRVNDAVLKAKGYGFEQHKEYYNNIKYRRVAPDTVQIPDSFARINIPVIVVFGLKTYSAAEDFLLMLSEIKDRPLFIGEETGGSTGSPLVIRIVELNPP